MSVDSELLAASRDWITNPCRDAWVKYLMAWIRAGKPVFTDEEVNRACGGEVLSFSITDTGFTATVKKAERPAIERTYRVRMGLDMENESFPIWDTWGGTIQIAWDDCLGLPQLQIDAEGDSDGDGGNFAYEGGDVTDSQQMVDAFNDCSGWSR